MFATGGGEHGSSLRSGAPHLPLSFAAPVEFFTSGVVSVEYQPKATHLSSAAYQAQLHANPHVPVCILDPTTWGLSLHTNSSI